MHTSLFSTVSLLLLSITTLVTSAAVPQNSDIRRPPVCRVPLIAFNSLNYQFNLQVQNSANHQIHDKYLRFIGVGTPGDYRVVLQPSGSAERLSFGDGKLSFSQARRKYTAYLKAAVKPWGNRRAGFIINPKNPWKGIAAYGCDEFGKQQLEIKGGELTLS